MKLYKVTVYDEYTAEEYSKINKVIENAKRNLWRIDLLIKFFISSLAELFKARLFWFIIEMKERARKLLKDWSIYL